jgi:hypothetical protein
MRYMALIYHNEAVSNQQSQEVRGAVYAAHIAFGTAAREAGVLLVGEALHDTPSATTVRVRNGEVLTTDGPFAETKEQLGGYYVLDCKDLDEAIEWAAKIPGADAGSIEVRPLVEFD